MSINKKAIRTYIKHLRNIANSLEDALLHASTTDDLVNGVGSIGGTILKHMIEHDEKKIKASKKKKTVPKLAAKKHTQKNMQQCRPEAPQS